MSHADVLEATLDALIDDAARLTEAARLVVRRARMGLDNTYAIAALAVELDRLDAGNGEGIDAGLSRVLSV